MLNIFADSLLLAARMTPPAHLVDSRRPADPEAEVAARRRWLSLSGMRR